MGRRNGKAPPQYRANHAVSPAGHVGSELRDGRVTIEAMAGGTLRVLADPPPALGATVLERLELAEEGIRRATRRRDRLVIEAALQGHSWGKIGAAVGRPARNVERKYFERYDRERLNRTG